jgi:peptidoglycan/LPS O-acetylase OafA/YrhL
MDGLRGIAAISVVLLHLKNYGVYPFKHPNHAVDLFFIMSGFVIANAYENKIRSFGFIYFIKRRLVRLYPTYALSLTITPLFTIFIFLISRGHMALTTVLISVPFQLFYLPTPPYFVPAGRSCYILNGPSWSLLWELFVNALYALTVRRLTNRILFLIILLSALGLLAILLCGTPIDTGSDWPTFYIGFVRVLYGFPAGVLIFRLRKPKFDTPFWFLALLSFSTLFLPSIMSLFMILPLVVWLATGSLADSPILRWLGYISYPLYAIHSPLISPLDWFLHHLLRWIDPMAVGLFDLIAFCAIAWIIGRWWDQPIRALLDKRMRVGATATASAG